MLLLIGACPDQLQLYSIQIIQTPATGLIQGIGTGFSSQLQGISPWYKGLLPGNKKSQLVVTRKRAAPDPDFGG